ncbi:hypothetical protein AAHC03_020811 [Spirometra sp. Aus1]
MGKSPKEHTGEFKYNPQVTSCKDKGSKHRSKMPYIQFSIRQDRHKQEQSSNPPFMPVPQGETAATSSAWYSRDSQPLGNETSQNKEPRCLSGPAVAFGSKAPRFPSDGRGVSGGNPPPGAYDPYKPRKERSKLFQPFTLAPILNRSVPIKDDVGPATYKFESPIDKELRELKAKTKAFDAFSEPRLAPMKHGYYVVDPCHDLGPGSVDFPSMTDLLKSRHNNTKGKFMKTERFPKKPHERIFLQIPVNLRPDKSNQIGPVTYDNRIPEWKSCKLKSSKAPFNLHRMARMSEKEYNEFIGNRNPYSGPGRYTPYEFENAHNRRFQGLFKVVPRNFDAQKYKVQSERNRALNVPPTDPEKCPAPVASSLKLR